MSIVCCDNQSRTLCGQDVFEGVKCAEDCSLCLTLAGMRPLPCPEGGHCDKVGASEAETPKVADLGPLLRGKLGDPVPAFEKPKRKLSELRNLGDWWTDDDQPTIPPDVTDKDLLDIIFERIESSRKHEPGNHECPCWRCHALRKAGYFPSAPFSEKCSDMYIQQLREKLS